MMPLLDCLGSDGDVLTHVIHIAACRNYSETYTSKAKAGSVTADEVPRVSIDCGYCSSSHSFHPQLANESFPLCMRHIQDVIHEVHHVKHNARLQYGLFLKV